MGNQPHPTTTPTNMTEQDTEELVTFEITASRTFETDIPQEEIQQKMKQRGILDREAAVEAVLQEREVSYIEPQEKLLSAAVRVSEVE